MKYLIFIWGALAADDWLGTTGLHICLHFSNMFILCNAFLYFIILLYLILINDHDTSVDKELLGISYQQSLVYLKVLIKMEKSKDI